VRPELTSIGDGEAAKIAAIGEATAQAYNKQQEAIGEEAIKDGLMGQLSRLLPGVDLGALVKKPEAVQPKVYEKCSV